MYVTSAVATMSGWAASPLTASAVPCGTAADTVIIGVIIGQSSVANALTGMTIGGSSAGVSAVAEVSWGSDDNHRLFYWQGVGPGTVDIAFAWTGSISVADAYILVFSGETLRAAPVNTVASGGTTAPSLTVSSEVGDTAVAFSAYDPGANTVTASGAATLLMNTAGGLRRPFALSAPGASPTVAVVGAASGTIYRSLNYGFSLIPAGGGDVTAPVLTSPTGTATGSTTADVGATTDEAGGTIYGVVTTSATQPSVAQIKAGQDHTGAAAPWGGSQAVAATGVQTLGATGLTASTSYYGHLVHTDAAANDSNIVSSAQFTTSATGDTTPPSAPGVPSFASVTQTTYTATWTAATDDTAVTGYERRINGGAVTDLGLVLSEAVTGRTPGGSDTYEVRAYDAAGNRGAWASAGVTLALWGFDLHIIAGAVLGSVSGALTGLSREAAVSIAMRVYDSGSGALVHEAAAAVTDANGRLPRYEHAALGSATYDVIFRRVSDGAIACARLTTT